MASLSLFVGIIGNIISVFFILSPVKTFRRIVLNRSTEEFDCLPYVCTLLNAAFWTYYGLTKPGEILVATINAFAVVVEIVYITLFLVFAPPRIRAKTAFLVAVLDVGFPAAAILIIKLLLHGEMKIHVLGFICAGLSIIMFGSPLAAMKMVVTTGSVEYMPFYLSLFVFLTGGIWTFYGVLMKDLVLEVPNGVGFLLGAAQLMLYLLYRKSSKRLSHDVEDGWHTHEHLISSSSDLIRQSN